MMFGNKVWPIVPTSRTEERLRFLSVSLQYTTCTPRLWSRLYFYPSFSRFARLTCH